MCICSFAYSYILLHIENVDKEYAAGVEPEVEIQEPEGQLYVGADREQEPESEKDLTNIDNTQGKPRFIYPSVLHKV